MIFDRITTVYPNDLKWARLTNDSALVLDASGLGRRGDAELIRRYEKGLSMFTEETVIRDVEWMNITAKRNIPSKTLSLLYGLRDAGRSYTINPAESEEGRYLLDCRELSPKVRAQQYTAEYFDVIYDAISRMRPILENSIPSKRLAAMAKDALIFRMSSEFVDDLVRMCNARDLTDIREQGTGDYAHELETGLNGNQESVGKFLEKFQIELDRDICHIIVNSGDGRQRIYDSLLDVLKNDDDVRLLVVAAKVCQQGQEVHILTNDSDFRHLLYFARQVW